MNQFHLNQQQDAEKRPREIIEKDQIRERLREIVTEIVVKKKAFQLTKATNQMHRLFRELNRD